MERVVHRIEYDRGLVKARSGYSLPIRGDVRIFQGYNGSYSHFPKMTEEGLILDDSYSVDFAVPYGSEVLASKAGIVRAAWDRKVGSYNGLDLEGGEKFFDRTNLVLIEHVDASFSIYVHLEKDSCLVRRRDVVGAGDVIASTGESGWVGPEPHLHFMAYISKNGKLSFPVEFSDYDGSLEDCVVNAGRSLTWD